MGSLEKEIMVEEKLKDVGNRLLTPPSSVEELLPLLDEAENLLSHVDQAPSRSMQDALFPMLKALISSDFLKHSDVDVRVSVVSCATEISRITAPDAPYDDELMKEIFQLTVAAFEKLSHFSSRSYGKAVMILDTVAKVRSSLLLLDLECEGLVLDMFQIFFKTIRPSHPHAVYSAMEMIMTTIINESEDISIDLLDLVLSSVKTENQDRSPLSWKLGEQVLTNCGSQLKPYIVDMIQSRGLSLDMYSPLVASICQNDCGTIGAKNHVHSETDVEEKKISHGKMDLGVSNEDTVVGPMDAARPVEACQPLGHRAVVAKDVRGAAIKNDGLALGKRDKSGTKLESVPKKRGRKPNSLMNPDEGYDHPCIGSRKKLRRRSSGKRTNRKVADSSPLGNSVSKSLLGQVSPGLSSRLGKPMKSTKSKSFGRRSSQNDSLGRRSNLFKNLGKRRSRVKHHSTDHYADSTPLSVLMKRKSGIEVDKKASPVMSMSVKDDPSGDDQHNVQTSWKASGDDKNNVKTSWKASGDDKNDVKKSWKAPVKGRKRMSLDNKKQNSGNAIQSKVINEASGSKRLHSKSPTKSSEQSDEGKAVKSSGKRKRSVVKGSDGDKLDLGEELVGKRIKVWWPLDKRFYEGVVDLYYSVKKKHKVLYTDGETEVLNLKKERWELIENKTSFHREDPQTNLSETHPASDTLEKQLKRSEGKYLTPQVKSGSFARSRKRSAGRLKKKTDGLFPEAAEDDGSVSLMKNRGLTKVARTKSKGDEGPSTRVIQTTKSMDNNGQLTIDKPEVSNEEPADNTNSNTLTREASEKEAGDGECEDGKV